MGGAIKERGLVAVVMRLQAVNEGANAPAGENDTSEI